MDMKQRSLKYVSRYYKAYRLNIDEAYSNILRKSGLTEDDKATQTLHIQQSKRRRWYYGFTATAIVAAILCFVFVLMPKGNGDVINLVAQNDIAEYTLHDGTKVVLAPYSTLSYAESNCREVDITGQVYFDIIHDDAHPFIIKGKGFVINDLGTKLQVSESIDADNRPETNVIVSEGEVSFGRDNDSAHAVHIKAGQVARLIQGEKKPEVATATSTKMTWATHNFHFKNAPLDEVLDELSDYYKVNLHCDDTNHSLTADLNADSIDSIINIINETFDIEIQINK